MDLKKEIMVAMPGEIVTDAYSDGDTTIPKFDVLVTVQDGPNAAVAVADAIAGLVRRGTIRSTDVGDLAVIQQWNVEASVYVSADLKEGAE